MITTITVYTKRILDQMFSNACVTFIVFIRLRWKPQEHLQEYIPVFNRYIQELQPLFETDPLLLRLFVKVVAVEDLKLLINKVPMSMLLMRLTEELTYGYKVTYVAMYVA